MTAQLPTIAPPSSPHELWSSYGLTDNDIPVKVLFSLYNFHLNPYKDKSLGATDNSQCLLSNTSSLTSQAEILSVLGLSTHGRVSQVVAPHDSITNCTTARFLLNFKGIDYKTEWVRQESYNSRFMY
jgi:hypothetical protein